MLSSSPLGVLLGTLLVIASIPDAISYNKYGRTCKDIGCRSDEVCVMAEDPCSLYQPDNCGRYPTCAKSQPGKASCESTVCRENEYCKTENGVPTCVKKSNSIGYESAGVSYVNGHRVSTDENQDKNHNAGSNTNPYANANAPPAPVEPAGGFHQMNSGTNLGYPAYPSSGGSTNGRYPNTGGSNANGGYPPYPATNQGNRHHDSGYPPYPTQNRMPMPGYPGQNNPPYPAHPGYPQAPGYPQQYPGYQNYPYNTYPNQNRVHHNDNMNSVYRRSAAFVQTSSWTVLCLANLFLILGNCS